MTKICFIYTDTNGLHKCYKPVSTKNLYKIARLVAIHYMVGDYIDGKFTETIRRDIIIKPNAINFNDIAVNIHKITIDIAHMKGIDKIKAISQLKTDISDVQVIIGHSLPFHIKAIQGECFRTAIDINFNKYINIDMMSFGHKMEHPKYTELIAKYKINLPQQLDQYRELFLMLYKEYMMTVGTCNSKSKAIIKPEDDCDFID